MSGNLYFSFLFWSITDIYFCHQHVKKCLYCWCLNQHDTNWQFQLSFTCSSLTKKSCMLKAELCFSLSTDFLGPHHRYGGSKEFVSKFWLCSTRGMRGMSDWSNEVEMPKGTMFFQKGEIMILIFTVLASVRRISGMSVNSHTKTCWHPNPRSLSSIHAKISQIDKMYSASLWLGASVGRGSYQWSWLHEKLSTNDNDAKFCFQTQIMLEILTILWLKMFIFP